MASQQDHSSGSPRPTLEEVQKELTLARSELDQMRARAAEELRVLGEEARSLRSERTAFQVSFETVLKEKNDLLLQVTALRKECEKLQRLQPQKPTSPRKAVAPSPSRTQFRASATDESSLEMAAMLAADVPLVMLSGYRQDEEAKRQQLADDLIKLGCQISNEDFSPLVTHVVSPTALTRTMKVIAALLTSRWVVTDEWVTASCAARTLLPEDGFGRRLEASPIAGKTICFTAEFRKDQARVTNATTIAQLGGARIIEESAAADILLGESADQQKELSGDIPLRLRWPEFVDVIMGLPHTKKRPREDVAAVIQAGKKKNPTP